jgi:hypothetical protein
MEEPALSQTKGETTGGSRAGTVGATEVLFSQTGRKNRLWTTTMGY